MVPNARRARRARPRARRGRWWRLCCAGSARCAQLIGGLLDRGLPPQAPRVETALLLGTAQILFLRGARSCRGRSCGAAGAGRPLRRRILPVSSMRCCGALRAKARERLAALDTAVLDTPPWLMARWIAAYGEDTARAIAAANGREPALDLTVKSDAAALGGKARRPRAADRLGARGGPWRGHGAAGFRRRRVVGPGCRGGAAGRASSATFAAGASPIFAPRRAARRRSSRWRARTSPPSIARRRGSIGSSDNLARLSLAAELVCADAAAWTAEPFDAVLLDAPCSATGTIRRHPDVPWLKSASDIAEARRPCSGA